MESYELKYLDKILVPGDIVLIRGFQPNKFVVSKGKFEYDNKVRTGWFLKMIPSGAVMPLDDIDEQDITIVSSNKEEQIHAPSHKHKDHCHTKPPLQVYKPHKKPDNSFVTVDTLDERNNLFERFPPDGKIVRVNNVRGEVKYYVWDAESMRWQVLKFPSENEEVVDNFMTTTEEKLDVIENSVTWELEELEVADGE